MSNERQERIKLLALKKLAGALSDAEAGELRALCAEDDRLRRLADALLSEQLRASAGSSRKSVGITIQLCDSEEEEFFVYDSMQIRPENFDFGVE